MACLSVLGRVSNDSAACGHSDIRHAARLGYAAVPVRSVSITLGFGNVRPLRVGGRGGTAVAVGVQAAVRGRTMRAMRPGAPSSNARLPPCKWLMAVTMARPSPLPGRLRL